MSSGAGSRIEAYLVSNQGFLFVTALRKALADTLRTDVSQCPVEVSTADGVGRKNKLV